MNIEITRSKEIDNLIENMKDVIAKRNKFCSIKNKKASEISLAGVFFYNLENCRFSILDNF